MATVLDFSLCAGKGCDSLTFTELTGPYSSPSNLTGWGDPNTIITNPTVANVTIVTPDDDTFILNALPDGFPTDNTSLQFVISSTDIGYGDKITDGLYTVTYDVTILRESGDPEIPDTVITLTQTKYFLVACNIKCCIDKMFVKAISADCDGCNDDKLKKALTANALYKGLISAGICGDRTSITKILTRLNKLCNVKDCNCN